MTFKESMTIKMKAVGILAFLFMMAMPGKVYSSIEEQYGLQDVEMLVGDFQPVKVKNLSRISLIDPSIADVSDVKTDEIMLMAQRPGQTVLFLWDEYGKRSIVIRVVQEDMGLVRARIAKLLKKAEIKDITMEENNYEARIVVSGEIAEEDADKFSQILSPFGESIINFTKAKEVKDQIQIDMQITELNTSVTKNLGLLWTTDTKGENFRFNYPETLPVRDNSFGDLFKIGDFARTNAILASVEAYIREGKGRVLSKPRIVVVNGKQASFLVGGEIPFKTVTFGATGTTSTEVTTFKSYGVSLSITPTIHKEKIEIDLNVEVSDVDTASGIAGSFVTRSATTHLNLDDNQTIVLAGLIKKTRSELVRRIPFISKIPIVGKLFTNKSSPTGDQDTELVISLTPRILKDMTAKMSKTDTEIKSGKDSSPNYYSDNERSSIPHAYAQALQKRISSSINYPYEAKENGWEGTVKISLRILKDGSLADATVQQSSGHNILDEDALNTAKILAPYSPFSSDMIMEDLVVVVPIVYSQKSNF